MASLIQRILTAYVGAELSLNGSGHRNVIEGVLDYGGERFCVHFPNAYRLNETDLQKGKFMLHLRDIASITDGEFKQFVIENFATQIRYYRTASTSYRIDRYTNTIEMHIGSCPSLTGGKPSEVFVVMTDFKTVGLCFKHSAGIHMAPVQSLIEFRDWLRPSFDMGYGTYWTLKDLWKDNF